MAFDKWKQSVIIYSLNNLRNKQIADYKYMDLADETLIKIIKTRKKKFKIV